MTIKCINKGTGLSSQSVREVTSVACLKHSLFEVGAPMTFSDVVTSWQMWTQFTEGIQ